MHPISRTRSRWLVAASTFVLVLATASIVRAQTALPASVPPTLEEVIVTGSLIPQAHPETSTPVLVIQSEDLQLKGFATIADALQHSAIATGTAANAQFTGSFTQAAQTLSLFGLSASYTKYLIDGRPMSDYPALYLGTDIITSIDGIPTNIVDHIDVLPGGQSSIYGSDAIAGVVNIVLKKRMDGGMADARIGWTKDGGGTEKRLGLVHGFSSGSLSVVAGAQYQKTDPIWGFQRPLTDQYYAAGSSPQAAARDWLVYGLFGQPNGDLYYMQDPALCGNVTSQFGGTAGLRSRAGAGQWCGTYRAGYTTINNGTESEQGYLHATVDLSDATRVFTSVLIDHDVALFNGGPLLFTTGYGSNNYFYDPAVTPCQAADGSDCDLLNLWHMFSPEEAGNFRGQNDKDTKNSVRATLGIEGQIGASSWLYQADVSYTETKLNETTFLAFNDKINGFFASIMGPNLGPDPIFGQPTYNVDFARFYQPITPAQYASFTGYASSHSRTEDGLARIQVTNSTLFALPGGRAGVAIVLEAGPQGWDYAPDPSFLNGVAYLYTATFGSGHRSRTAGTIELRLPILDRLTVNMSERYDDYRVSGHGVTKDTYTGGVEFRPLKSLLLRGRYGTSFKAPTLSDEFQGSSGYYTFATDYYTCTKKGYSGANLGQCPQANEGMFDTTSGNTRLESITAKNWDVGLVWTPLDRLSVNVDYLHWQINNEVQQLDFDQLLRTNAACLLGQLPIDSPTCVQAIAFVTRDSNGQITQISTPKVNVASEVLGVVVAGFSYAIAAGRAGEFRLDGSYSDLLKHTEQAFAGDTVVNLLTNPFYSIDFKTKENLSIGWNRAKGGVTAYIERYGGTPNYVAYLSVTGYATPGAGTVGTWTLANLSGHYQLTPELVLQGNINNLLNKMPPEDHSVPGFSNLPFSAGNYNNYGRSYFVGAEYRFGK